MNFYTVIAIFIITLLSISFHEFSHAFVAYLLGDDTAKKSGRMTINPIKHIDIFMTIIVPLITSFLGVPFGGAKPVPIDKTKIKWGDWGMALVAVAGPLSNFLLAVIALFFYVISLRTDSSTMSLILINVAEVNLSLFVFNMIPIPPLDGSRLLNALAPESIKRLLAGLENYGFFILSFILIIFSNQISIIITKFVGSIINFIVYLFCFIA